MSTTPDTALVRDLADQVSGPVISPDHPGYDEARSIYNGLIDRRPALIVRCRTASDVVTVLAHARRADLEVSVRGGGHNVAGRAVTDGGIMISLSDMKQIAVDPERAIVTAGGGVTWGELNAAAGAHGLAVTGGVVSTTGIAGYTLGGGLGWLMARYGLAADNLHAVELVTAAGDVLFVDSASHPDLFWALRGGGGNFGIVCSLEFQLHPAPSVYGGMVFFDAGRARATLARYVEWSADEPDESNTALTVMRMPPIPQVPEPIRGRRVLSLRSFYVGDPGTGERVIAPLLEVAGEPLMGGLQAMSFAGTMGVMGPPPPPSVGEVTIELFHEVGDDVLDILADPDSPVTALELRHWGGAMARPGANAGPIGHRDVPFSVAINQLAPDREHWEAARAALEAVDARLRPYATGGGFLNFLSDPSRTRDAYTDADWARLQAVKATYDAANVFGRGHAIASS
jgi:FAD/FMN-containing dehydrogenase